MTAFFDYDTTQKLGVFKLSTRQMQVISMRLRGLNQKEVSKELGIGYRDVSHHQKRAFQKMKIKRLSEVPWAIWQVQANKMLNEESALQGKAIKRLGIALAELQEIYFALSSLQTPRFPDAD